MTRLIDTHCHVQFNAYKNDMNDVIKRTLEKGVFMITVGTQKDTSKRGLEVAEKYEGLWAAIGLHPCHLTKQEFSDNNEIWSPSPIKTREEVFDLSYYRELARHPKCVAIGECGLEYFHIPEDVGREEVILKQKQTVRAHFDLADEVSLPVIIHCRDAYDDQIQIVREYVQAGKLPCRGVAHCFAGTLEQARELIDLGFYVSFTGILAFPPRKNEIDKDGLSPIQAMAKKLPLDRILIETDAPYLSPPPYRGKRNEPWHVQFVAEKLAELKGLSVDDVAAITTENASKLFGI